MTDLSSQYQKLDQRTHIETRPSMYVGSIANEDAEKWVLDDAGNKFEKVALTYNAGLLKLFDEILMNSVDEAVKGNVTQIDISYNPMDGEITVKDNGGIPVVKHKEHDQYIPEMIFGEFMAGSNFGDDRQGAGMNGFGAKLVVVFSERFSVTTCDGKKSFVQVFTDNMRHCTTPLVKGSKTKGTTISYIPDYNKFEVEMDINSPDYKMMEKRVYDVAACNPKIKITFGGEEIKFKSFEQYVKMYNADTVSEVTDTFSVTITPSQNDSFEAVSFVNNIDTYNGGTHIDYVVSQIIAEIRADIKRKYKIDVKPNNIKQQMNVFVSCNISSPMFTSQTKEFLSSPVKDYGTSYTPSKAFIKKVLASKVVEQVVAWAEGERRRQDEAELKKLDKASKASTALKRIIKFEDAGSRNRDECTLILTEGDSAKKPLVSARDPILHAVYPLKGKPLNVRGVSTSKLAANAEFSELIQIMGISPSKKNDMKSLRYGKILIAADYDLDGCLVGDTPIPLLDGRVVPIEDLVGENEFWLYSYTENGEVGYGRGHSARVTREVTTLLEVTLDNGEAVRCTHNHPFMLKNGSFVRADELVDGMALMPQDFNQSHVIDVSEIMLDEPVPVYDITVDGYHNFALAQGCVVHNSHICGLLINMFHHFWPDMIKQGLVYRLKTPLIIATAGTTRHEFFDKPSYFKWAETAPRHSYKYFKGLSSFKTNELKKYLDDEKYWVLIEHDDTIDECIGLAFDKSRANDRKTWLETGVDADASA